MKAMSSEVLQNYKQLLDTISISSLTILPSFYSLSTAWSLAVTRTEKAPTIEGGSDMNNNYNSFGSLESHCRRVERHAMLVYKRPYLYIFSVGLTSRMQ